LIHGRHLLVIDDEPAYHRLLIPASKPPILRTLFPIGRPAGVANPTGSQEEGWFTMASLRKHGDVWYYRYVDADGKKRDRKGCPDKRVMEELARAAESEAAKIRTGLVNPKDMAYRDHEARPLSGHIDAWQANMLSEGATPKHAELASNRVRRLVAIMLGSNHALQGDRVLKPKNRPGFVGKVVEIIAPARLSDLSTERVQGAIGKLKDQGLSLQSCNHYRAAIRAFAKWCHDTYRTREHVLRGVKGYNAKEDRRHDRQTLSLDELRRLVDAADRGTDYHGMSGPLRALCYRTAAATGLRFSELACLNPESFDWEAPSVTVVAGYAKNRETPPRFPCRITWRATWRLSWRRVPQCSRSRRVEAHVWCVVT
jgi:hypothetical protein